MGNSIVTQRLLLRPFCMEDIPDVHALLDSDPEVKRYTGGVCSYERTADYFQGVIQASAENPQALVRWAVLDTAAECLIGWCGLQPLYFDSAFVEIGYGLARAYWGQGMATEAARSMLNYGFTTLGLPSIVAVVNPNNQASSRVLEKSGMRFRGIVNDGKDGKDGKGDEVRFYEAANPNYPNKEARQPCANLDSTTRHVRRAVSRRNV